MIKIQIIFLYTSYKSLTAEQQERVKGIVCEEYCKAFNCNESDVNTILCNAYAEGNTNDIVLTVSGNERVINEGLKIGSMKSEIITRLSLLSFMKNSGFSGKIEYRQGEIKAETPASKQVSQAEEGKSGALNSDDYRERAKAYTAQEPRYSMDMLQISQDTLDQIDRALGRIQYEREIFEEWGLYSIMPSPVSAMSFYGPPGTGKTLAAEAIASRLGKKIIMASYADIENKYVGEGPKNVGAIFLAAEQQDAVLFIDEADSLLSKRLVNVSDPSGQAMNSMRSQLLICLEKFHGIVIFATNLAVNYDRAFLSRLINIQFEFPDASQREKIWHAHLYPNNTSKVKLSIPLAEDVDLKALAEKFRFCGRDICGAVVDACVLARMSGLTVLNQECLMTAAKAVEKRNIEVENTQDHTAVNKPAKEVEISPEAREIIAKNLEKSIR